MRIITVCSHIPKESYYCANSFFESCRRFGHEPIVLGRDGAYKGLGSKLRLLKEYLDAHTILGPMIFCDSFDVVFQRDPLKIEPLFLERAAEHAISMVFNAERTLFPFNEEVNQGTPLSETSYRFLNSGFIVGFAGVFKECLKLLNADKIPDDYQREDGSWVTPNDQELWQRLFVVERKHMGLALDTRAEICQTLANVLPEELDFSEPLIRNKETDTYPIAIHCNGRKEEWLPLILSHLKLDATKTQTDN